MAALLRALGHLHTLKLAFSLRSLSAIALRVASKASPRLRQLELFTNIDGVCPLQDMDAEAPLFPCLVTLSVRRLDMNLIIDRDGSKVERHANLLHAQAPPNSRSYGSSFGLSQTPSNDKLRQCWGVATPGQRRRDLFADCDAVPGEESHWS